MKKLKVKEIFHSIQGEGAHAGEASIFIRLSGCNQNCSYCDTDWAGGDSMSVEEIYEKIRIGIKSKRIIWTGGEPLLQLDSAIIRYFNYRGYKQSIETNGSIPLPRGLDYVVCSPKVDEKTINENFEDGEINEFRYPIGIFEEALYEPPKIYDLPSADYYFVSPIFVGEPHKRLKMDEKNLEIAIKFIKHNPKWRLSIQQQKIWGIL